MIMIRGPPASLARRRWWTRRSRIKKRMAMLQISVFEFTVMEKPLKKEQTNMRELEGGGSPRDLHDVEGSKCRSSFLGLLSQCLRSSHCRDGGGWDAGSGGGEYWCPQV